MSKPYQSPPGYHRHQCYNCGFIWEHEDRDTYDRPAHTCSECGAETFTQYRGRKAPQAARQHQEAGR